MFAQAKRQHAYDLVIPMTVIPIIEVIIAKLKISKTLSNHPKFRPDILVTLYTAVSTVF